MADPKDEASKANQQRQFVRVDDTLPMSWRKLESDAYAKIAEYFEKHDIFPPKPGGINATLKSLDITDPLKQLQRKDANMAEILGRLDQKLNLLIRLFHPQDDDQPMVMTPMNLSGGGLAFWQHSPQLESGDLLELRLSLGEDALLTLEAYTRVIVVLPNDRDGMTRVACKFDPILPNDQEQIIQHIFKRQSHLLRAKRKR
uniref:PilZ domain-containing protein n=1 Tax=Magnetococcus massalia (strain MO-1) TaxID=451514 RepID=A0A1S7LFT4_MAGMO|nr:conserved protein of unknown function [including conserved PilZ domain] [Candidatus Magnetococcus massalia]